MLDQEGGSRVREEEDSNVGVRVHWTPRETPTRRPVDGGSRARWPRGVTQLREGLARDAGGTYMLLWHS